MLCITMIVFSPIIVLSLSKLKKFILVYLDYKNQEKETKIVFVKNQRTSWCEGKFNGVYKIFCCSDTLNGDKVEYWMYRKSLIYDEACIGRQYKITYYKKSKCLHSIEPVSNDLNTKKDKPKIKKSVKIQEKKVQKSNILKEPIIENSENSIVFNIVGLCTLPGSLYILLKLWSIKEIIGNFYIIFFLICLTMFFLYFLIIKQLLKKKSEKIVTERVTTLGIPFNTEIENSIIAGVPFKIYSAKRKNIKIFLKVQNDKGRKKDLILQSYEQLNLGDLKERTGFLGFGNFIGMEYDVEYYKTSKIIKSMKIINQPYQ